MSSTDKTGQTWRPGKKLLVSSLLVGTTFSMVVGLAGLYFHAIDQFPLFHMVMRLAGMFFLGVNQVPVLIWIWWGVGLATSACQILAGAMALVCVLRPTSAKIRSSVAAAKGSAALYVAWAVAGVAGCPRAYECAGRPEQLNLALAITSVVVLPLCLALFPLALIAGLKRLLQDPGLGASRFARLCWRLLLATIVMVVAAVGFLVWFPYHQEQQIAERIKSWGGRVVGTETAGPDWLLRIAGDRMRQFEVFERITGVDLEESAVTDSDIPYLSGLAKLKSLWLHRTAVSDSGVHDLKMFKYLEDLTIGRTAVTDAGLADLGRMRIKELSLIGTAVTDVGLAHLSQCSSLRDLALQNTAVTDAGLVHLSRLKWLDHLDLIGTAVTDAGLAHLTECTNLEFVGLSRTSVTDDGLIHLSGCKYLIQIDLNGTSVTDAGLIKLAGFKNLHTVFALDTAVTDAGVERLKTALPYCDVFYRLKRPGPPDK